MKTLFQVAYMIVDKVEVATFHLENEDEIAAMVYFSITIYSLGEP